MAVVLDTTKTKKQSAPKPAALDLKALPVRVNGVAIARDAIQREMQHHAAAKPIAARATTTPLTLTALGLGKPG